MITMPCCMQDAALPVHAEQPESGPLPPFFHPDKLDRFLVAMGRKDTWRRPAVVLHTSGWSFK